MRNDVVTTEGNKLVQYDATETVAARRGARRIKSDRDRGPFSTGWRSFSGIWRKCAERSGRPHGCRAELWFEIDLAEGVLPWRCVAVNH